MPTRARRAPARGAGQGAAGEYAGGGGAGHAALGEAGITQSGAVGQGPAGAGGGTYGTAAILDPLGGSGGGGASGDVIGFQTDETGGSGGAGGGGLVIVAQNTLNLTEGTLNVSGGSGGYGNGTDWDGGGGGGSGGSIILVAPVINRLPASYIYSYGGAGGDTSYYTGNSGYPYYFPYYAYGAEGGNGAGGRVAFYCATTPNTADLHTGGSVYRNTVDEPSFVYPAALTAPPAGNAGLPDNSFSIDGLQTTPFHTGPKKPDRGNLFLHSDGNFYGTSYEGGTAGLGTIYRVTPAGVVTTVVSFTGTAGSAMGRNPSAALVSDGVSTLWGATRYGGTSDLGTVFKYNLATGVFALVHQFTGTNGSQPMQVLASDNAGFWWGTTYQGGTNNAGTVFKINQTDGGFTKVIDFAGTTTAPRGRSCEQSLTYDGAGLMWGTTSFGGAGDFGTIFKIDISTNALTTVKEFTGTTGSVPGIDPDGNLVSDGVGFFWGTCYEGGAQNRGTLFKINATTGAFTTLLQFAETSSPKGAFPIAALYRDDLNNVMWGTTRLGGNAASPLGTIFKINRDTGVLTTVKEFTNTGSLRGSHLFSGLTPDAAGNLWGTTRIGGNGNVGTIYKLNPTTEVLTTVAELGATSGQGRAVAVQPDGKTVVAGFVHNGANNDFAVVRYLADGAVDTAFGKGGTAVADFGYDDTGTSVALQGDGKIVVAGAAGNGANQDFGIARFNADGTLDSGLVGDATPGDSFGTGGLATTPFGTGNDAANGMALQSNGGIVVVGETMAGTIKHIAIARYSTSGILDPGFGTSGKRDIYVGDGVGANAVAVQPDGRIVVVGTVAQSGQNDFFAMRFLSNGLHDASFNTTGTVMTAVGGSADNATSVALQRDGKILVGGMATNAASNYDFAVVRYTTDGDLDTTFGSGGKVTTAVGADHDQSYGIAVQPDGRIVLVGWISNGTDKDMAVVRYNADGSLDTLFDGDGKVTLAPGSADDALYGLALQADGMIVAAGSHFTGAVSEFAVVRLIGGPNDLLVNGGFESAESFGGGIVTGFGDWGWDVASSVTAENGITPYQGARMLKFLTAGPTAASGSPWCDVPQYVDMSAYATQIALGTVSATATAKFNRVAGNPTTTDTRFDLIVETHSGTVPGPMTSQNDVSYLHNDPGVWKQVTNTTVVPSGTTHLLVGVYAYENVVQNSSSTEFDGHYADDVQLTINVAPFAPTFADASTVGGTMANPTLTGWSLGTVTLGYAPTPGTSLMLVKNTGLNFIQGQFANLAQGQTVPLTYNGVTYNFAANYYGGTGNDLVLQWAGMGPVVWGGQSFDVRSYTSPFKAIAAGELHTVALKTDGTVVAWGFNGSGRTTVPAGLSGVSTIAAGAAHSVALKTDGTVVAWGNNGSGQTTVPAGLSGVSAIAAGGYHTVALKTDGTVVAWGYNDYGQTTVPAGLSGVIAIAAGGDHTVALKTDGTVVAWGSNGSGQTTVPAGLSGW